MTKDELYSGKRVVAVEWWLHEPDLPDLLRWARLRVFDDGMADSTFSLDGTSYAFLTRDFASFILSEDEFTCFTLWDVQDEVVHGLDRATIATPTWKDPADKPFEFLGKY